MSERDDEYLWSGQGTASDDLDRLEKLLGGEKLRDPLRARRRRLPVAILVGAAAAAAAFAFTRDAAPPMSWAGAVLPGVSGDELTGGVFEFELVDQAPPAGWQKMIEDRLADYPSHSIRVSGRRIEIAFFEDVPERLPELVARRGDFAIKEVVESSPLMRALYTRVSEGDPRARELGITAEIDGWDLDETGQRYTDWYLTAPTAEALTTYLAEVGAANPRLVPDDAHEIALEPHRPPDSDEPTAWRTYYLDRVVWLSNADVTHAYVYWNDNTNRPEVLVEYSREGAERFAELTGRIVGRKLAIMLDGQVSSAPVVQDRIEGGRTSITMGRGNPRELQDEAQALVDVLLAGRDPLPVALRLVRTTYRPDQLSEAQLQAVRIAISALFGLLVFAVVFLAERTSGPIDPEVAPVRGRPRRRALPWLRLLVSAAGAVAAVLAQRIPVTSDVDWSLLGAEPVSMFALGIMPAISAFLLVELAALLVPRWRRLRTGGPSARARLGSATAILTILIALVQSWLIADFLTSIEPLAYLSRPMLVASFTGGALLMTMLALVVSRYGLGNGFVLLFLAGQGAIIYRLLAALADGESSLTWVLPVVAIVAAAALATSWILRLRVRGPSAASALRLPTAGVVPLMMLPALLALLSLTWPEAAARIGIWWQDTVQAGVVVALLFVIVLGALLSWLFSRPARLGDATASGTRPKTFLVAVAISIAYLALLVLLADWVGHVVVGLAQVALVTAIVMDLIAEWRATTRRDDLVPIWPLHQVQRIELVTAALATNGIDVHARGLYFRLLLHFFAPFAPVLLHVPRQQAEEARAIIRAQLDVK